jgi:hypothetical protein
MPEVLPRNLNGHALAMAWLAWEWRRDHLNFNRFGGEPTLVVWAAATALSGKACYSVFLIGPKRIDGRPNASQIASTSAAAASFWLLCICGSKNVRRHQTCGVPKLCSLRFQRDTRDERADPAHQTGHRGARAAPGASSTP